MHALLRNSSMSSVWYVFATWARGLQWNTICIFIGLLPFCICLYWAYLKRCSPCIWSNRHKLLPGCLWNSQLQINVKRKWTSLNRLMRYELNFIYNVNKKFICYQLLVKWFSKLLHFSIIFTLILSSFWINWINLLQYWLAQTR